MLEPKLSISDGSKAMSYSELMDTSLLAEFGSVKSDIFAWYGSCTSNSTIEILRCLISSKIKKPGPDSLGHNTSLIVHGCFELRF